MIKFSDIIKEIKITPYISKEITLLYDNSTDHYYSQGLEDSLDFIKYNSDYITIGKIDIINRLIKYLKNRNIKYSVYPSTKRSYLRIEIPKKYVNVIDKVEEIKIRPYFPGLELIKSPNYEHYILNTNFTTYFFTKDIEDNYVCNNVNNIQLRLYLKEKKIRYNFNRYGFITIPSDYVKIVV